MSELPKGWAICSPSDLTTDPKNDIVDGPFGSNLNASEYTDEGTPIIRIQNVKRMQFVNKNIKFVTNNKADTLKRHSFVNGDILITKLGEPLGLACIVPDSLKKGIIVADIVRLRSHSSVDRKCLAYLINSERVIKQINAHTKGSTRARINLSVVRNLHIAIPPQAEQTRIVEKLDEVLAQVDTIKARLDGIPAILKRFRQSVLAAAVSGRLTKTLSKWRNEKLKDCFDCIDGDRGPNYPKKEEYLTEGYCLFLSTKNVRNFGFDFNEKIFITKEKDEILRKGRLERGDLVITTRGTLGYVASYDMTVPHEVVRINSGMLILRKKDPEFINDYFKILIASPYFQKQIEIQRTGSAQPQLPANVLKEFELPVPSYEEQKEIIRLVEQYFAFADTIEAQVKKAQARVDNLTQSILAKAFRGELVAQDPADEPAEKLLERIVQARKEAEALAKAAKKVAKTK